MVKIHRALRLGALQSIGCCLLALCCVLALTAWSDGAQAAPRHKQSQTQPTDSTSTSASDASTATTPKRSNDGQLLDRIVAVVDDGVVLESELDARVREITAQLQAQSVALPPEATLRSQVLDQLIIEEIEAQHADHAGIKVSDEQLNEALEEVAKQQNVTLEELPQKLAQDGGDYAQYRDEMRREIAREMLRQRDVMQRIVITPRELDQYLQQQRNSSDMNEYNVSHILIAIAQDATPTQLAQASKLAHDIADRARDGEDFAKLAVTYSQSETALQGGLLGWRKGSELPTFLVDVIERLKPGEVSDVIQTSSGFHVVKLNEKRSVDSKPQIVQQYHLRHILIKPTELEDDATVQQKLNEMRTAILAGREDFAVLAKTNSQDPGSAVNGGDLGWAELGNYVPEFSSVAAGLKEGEISQPFHTQFGWHIVQMLGRRDYNNSSEAGRERAYAALRASRAEEATELWRQQIRDESYVELRL
jgi:peptidyl-prolyl cis-trans isomerase SurA